MRHYGAQGAVLDREGTGKPEAPLLSRCGTIKSLPCLKVVCTEHRPISYHPSPAVLMSSLHLILIIKREDLKSSEGNLNKFKV